MAHISREDIDKVASLAKLEFSSEEKDTFAAQFDKIVGFVEKISELDTGSIQPMTHAVEKENVLRQDVVIPSMDNSAIGQIAPKFSDGSIIVPKIIEY